VTAALALSPVAAAPAVASADAVVPAGVLLAAFAEAARSVPAVAQAAEPAAMGRPAGTCQWGQHGERGDVQVPSESQSDHAHELIFGLR